MIIVNDQRLIKRFQELAICFICIVLILFILALVYD
jgi:hypothetical protein